MMDSEYYYSYKQQHQHQIIFKQYKCNIVNESEQVHMYIHTYTEKVKHVSRYEFQHLPVPPIYSRASHIKSSESRRMTSLACSVLNSCCR